MTEKQIELIQRQIEKLEEKEFDLDAWTSSTNVILGRIFGNNHRGIKAIDKIELQGGGIVSGDSSFTFDNIASCKKQGKDILEACITELKTFGQPEKKETTKSGINISLTQNQNQTVNIKLLISALENELTVTQLKEINDLMKTEEPLSQKKSRIIEALKRFGSNVASTILANILTNPNIWSNLRL